MQPVAPLYFSANPLLGNPCRRGFSIGHGSSKTYLQLRMCDATGSAAVANFRYAAPLQTQERNVFEITCARTNSYRVCSVAVNGRQTTPPSARLNVRGNVS